jgi:hypothetical protein
MEVINAHSAGPAGEAEDDGAIEEGDNEGEEEGEGEGEGVEEEQGSRGRRDGSQPAAGDAGAGTSKG